MRRVRFCAFLTSLLLATSAFAAESWQSIQQQATGQTVWFNARAVMRPLTATSTG